MTIQVPGYTVQKLLGEGGMASVFLATQQSLDRLVALKVLKKFDTEAQVKRFFNEGKIIASLNHHNIITIHNLGEVNGRCFLAMEYLEGGDLKQRINSGLQPDESLQLIKLIAHSLDFVHQRDIIHRDIKPENILFRKDGAPVLTDFGVAKQLQTDTSLTMDGSAIGSPHYISPEQAEQKPLDPRTDIYSLGIIFYEMLTGHTPFQGDSPIEIIIAHLTTEAAPLPKNLACYQELLDLMIAKDANDRFESAAELIDYLEKFQNHSSKHALTKKFSHIVSVKERAVKASANESSSPLQTHRFLKKTIGFGLAFTLSVSAAVYFYPDKNTKPALPEKALSENAMDEDPIVDKPPVLINQNQINQLLAEAEVILNDPQPSLPVLKNAYDTYNQVLDLDSDNEKALQGIVHIATLFSNIQEEIDFTLAEADKAVRAFRLTSPANNNAMFYYQKVLYLDPNNAEAQQGRLKVADAYADLVESNLTEFEYEKAKTNLNKGLSIYPTSPRLLALKKQTNAFTDAPKRLFGKIKSIFD